jgi:putative endonuclease
MSFFVYIIYSPSIDQFYIGQTVDLKERLIQHNSGYFKDSFTKNGAPWEIYFFLICSSKTQAILIEQHIKKMKSRKYYSSLAHYQELSERLLQRFR